MTDFTLRADTFSISSSDTKFGSIGPPGQCVILVLQFSYDGALQSRKINKIEVLVNITTSLIIPKRWRVYRNQLVISDVYHQ